MTLSVEPQADSDQPAATARRTMPRKRWLVLAVVVLAAIGFLGWLGLSLRSAAAAVKGPATQARADLTAMKSALQKGDQVAAKSSLASAHANLAAASLAAQRPAVRIAGVLPVLSSPVSDLRHLLGAAGDLVQGGDRVVALYDDVSGKDSKLFHGGGFNLAAIHTAHDSVSELTALLDSAERQLDKVVGGPLAPGAKEARDSALKQIAGLRKDAQPLVNILGVLPNALGEKSKKCYLITLLNQAELRPGGGAPLSLSAMCLDHGAMELQPTQATYDVSDGNQKLQWTPVDGNEAWHPRGQALPFASANRSPDWPTSGEELLRAYEVMAGSRADGVIGIDVTAMASLLHATGKTLTTDGYGEVTAETLPKTLLIDSYHEFDQVTRRKNNAELMTKMVNQLIEGGQLAGKFRALSATSTGHHLELYFRDSELQGLVQPTPMAGRLDPGAGDFAAVYTNNTTASKVDVYQDRSLSQDVVFNADGSATVTRTITITNSSPPYHSKTNPRSDPGVGYETTVSSPFVATYLPPGARVRDFQLVGTPGAKNVARRPVATDKGMRILQGYGGLPRGNSLTATVVYLTQPGQATGGYLLRLASQATLRPTKVTVSVLPPPGAKVTPEAGWQLDGARWTATFELSRDIDIRLPFTRG